MEYYISVWLNIFGNSIFTGHFLTYRLGGPRPPQPPCWPPQLTILAPPEEIPFLKDIDKNDIVYPTSVEYNSTNIICRAQKRLK
jgi:hypothetical protein